MPFELESESFTSGSEIPVVHTCDGAELSPHLAWSGAPEGTRSFALIVDDPDAPDPRAPKMAWVHWLLYNLPASESELPRGAAASGLPRGCRQGRNDWKRIGYGGPCPPVGRHRYVFRLYALDVVLPDLGAPTRSRLEEAMQRHVLARSELVGTYERRR